MGKNNPSLSARRNLWHSKTEENKYVRDIRAYINEFSALAKEALQRNTHTDYDGKETVDIAAFSAELEQIKQRMEKTKGTALAEEHTKAAYMLGIKYSDKTLKDAGWAEQ